MTRYEPVATQVADDDEENGRKYTEITEPLVTADKTQMRTIDSRYALDLLKSPDLQNIAWEDNFFDDDPDVVAVFDYDYEALEKFNSQTGYLAWASTLLYPPIFLATLACAAPCFLKQNVQWNARAQHVAITRDGIRYVRDRRKAGWGLSCTDRGKESKTVPFDKITDCDVMEPAGNTCICIPNILSYVNIDTASSGGPNGLKELRLAGLKDPHSFKKLVWAMKRSQRESAGNGPSAMEMTGRSGGDSGHGGQGGDVTSILLQIRDELRTHNDLLHRMQPPSTGSRAETVAAATTSAMDAIPATLAESFSADELPCDKSKAV